MEKSGVWIEWILISLSKSFLVFWLQRNYDCLYYAGFKMVSTIWSIWAIHLMFELVDSAYSPLSFLLT